MAQGMDQAYAQALWRAAKDGRSPEEAVAALHAALKHHNRLALMPRILRAFKRLADKEMRRTKKRITVARESDIKQAMVAAGVKEADICIDDTLIGGWRLETNDTLVDASFKRYLSDMFIRATEK